MDPTYPSIPCTAARQLCDRGIFYHAASRECGTRQGASTRRAPREGNGSLAKAYRRARGLPLDMGKRALPYRHRTDAAAGQGTERQAVQRSSRRSDPAARARFCAAGPVFHELFHDMACAPGRPSSGTSTYDRVIASTKRCA